MGEVIKDKALSPGDRAVELFDKGMRCSQAVFKAVAEAFGCGSEDVVAALEPFGGGLAATGRVCGALPGALAAVGFALSKNGHDPKERARHSAQASRGVVQAFEQVSSGFGGIDCSLIARVDWEDPRDVAAFRKGADGRRDRCRLVVREAADRAAALIERHLKGSPAPRGRSGRPA